MNDPIGDFIIRIKNASQVRKTEVLVPFSKMKLAIAKLLAEKGFVGEVSEPKMGK
jgi:small subunit ribosomal protein S8